MLISALKTCFCFLFLFLLIVIMMFWGRWMDWRDCPKLCHTGAKAYWDDAFSLTFAVINFAKLTALAFLSWSTTLGR